MRWTSRLATFDLFGCVDAIAGGAAAASYQLEVLKRAAKDGRVEKTGLFCSLLAVCCNSRLEPTTLLQALSQNGRQNQAPNSRDRRCWPVDLGFIGHRLQKAQTNQEQRFY